MKNFLVLRIWTFTNRVKKIKLRLTQIFLAIAMYWMCQILVHFLIKESEWGKVESDISHVYWEN